MAKEKLSLFDDNGKRITTVIKDVHYKTNKKREEYISQGYVVTSEEDFQYYIGNRGKGKNGTGYIRDAKTGKPIDAPAYVPTKKEQAEILYGICRSDLKAIGAQLVNAVTIDDTELIADLKRERVERIIQYQKDLAELEGGE